MDALVIEGTHFEDSRGNSVILRGINLAGDSKFPSKPPITSRESKHFFDGDHVSFLERPFPLVQADEHLSRIKAWGFNIVRYVFTWEAIEHAGPYVLLREAADNKAILRPGIR